MLHRLTLISLLIISSACSTSLVQTVPETDHVNAPGLSAPVDVLRDEQGVPHIYGDNLPDVAFAQGYVMAEDRLVQLDLARHKAEGTLSEIGGDLSPSLIDGDISMRMHHLRATSEQIFAQLQAASDPDSKVLVAALTKYAAGVNAYVADLQNGRYSLPVALILAYDPMTWKPWTEVDSIAIGHLITYQLSYDDTDLGRSALDAASAARFDMAGDPVKMARKGFAADLQILQPLDPTYTFPGDFSTLQPLAAASAGNASQLALYQADWKLAREQGQARWVHPEYGSNNWVIGPQLSATGHTLVANDPHLSLQNPPTFYLVHLVTRSGSPRLDVMGAQFPGAPGVILGMNEHVAWGATTSNLDVTDVYQEKIVPCDGPPGSTNPCVVFNGAKVAIVPRVETFDVGRFGHISKTLSVTFYDVPHHGPIFPRVLADHSGIEPLGSTEMSVRWTGHEPTLEVMALYGLDKARSVKEAETTLEQFFRVGGENWVLGDDQGHFGWTQATRVPRRPAGTVPWKVLAGDGSAEWQGDLDLRWVPHAFDPAIGFLATANADPVGVTDDGDPFASEMLVDGVPLYIGATFDPGTRVGRITKRLNALIAEKGKLSLDDLQSVQADDTSEWDQALAPTFLDAGRALAEEIAQPGKHPELSAMAKTADAPSKALVQTAVDLVTPWTFDTPENSVAATLFNVWVTRFYDLALVDEMEALGILPDDDQALKLLVRMCNEPQKLATGFAPSTGDSVLFDDLNTPVVIEGKRQMAAKGILDMIDYLIPTLGADATTWSWGRLHTLTLGGLVPLDSLQIPKKTDPMFPNGFPRHGDNGTVDVGHHGLTVDSFGYSEGPVIRAVYELDPKGVKARNALPGGETWDPESPHYRDLLELWRKNQTFDEAFKESDVVASAQRERMANGMGRVRFQPK